LAEVVPGGGSGADAAVAKIGAAQPRTKTVVLGGSRGSTDYVGNIIRGVLELYVMDPTTWNRKSKTAFFWAVMGVI
jgi:hypothetical protein